MKDDVTLAICMYNAERYIEETLQCICNQTKQDFHLLILNDCSTDNSAIFVETFFRQNPRQYELINLEENKGLCAGRRYVEENAKTKYILFVDSDDWPYPTLVEQLYNKIASDGDLIAVGCHLEYMDSNGHKMNGGIYLGETTKEDFILKAEKEKLIFMQPTAIYNREIALSVGGHNISGFPQGKPRYQDLCEDLDLWTRMSDLYKDGKAIIVIPEVLCRYRKHEKALSANSLGMILRMRHIKSNLKRRRKGLSELSFIEFKASLSDKELHNLEKDAKSADYLRNAYYCMKKGRVISFIGYLCKSIWNNPHYIVDKIKHNILRVK